MRHRRNGARTHSLCGTETTAFYREFPGVPHTWCFTRFAVSCRSASVAGALFRPLAWQGGALQMHSAVLLLFSVELMRPAHYLRVFVSTLPTLATLEDSTRSASFGSSKRRLGSIVVMELPKNLLILSPTIRSNDGYRRFLHHKRSLQRPYMPKLHRCCWIVTVPRRTCIPVTNYCS